MKLKISDLPQPMGEDVKILNIEETKEGNVILLGVRFFPDFELNKGLGEFMISICSYVKDFNIDKIKFTKHEFDS